MKLEAPPPIETPRLVLRIVRSSDLPDLLQVNGDEEVTRFLPYAAWKDLADGAAWFERMAGISATGAALQFVIEEKGTGRVIGTCLLFRYDAASARAEIGYVMGRASWRRGFTHEALAALVAHAFDACGLRRIEAEVDPANVASNRLLLKLGFTAEGLLRERWVSKGRTTDSNVYGLLSREWPGAKAGK
jgi:RimJ/RimL family protein N-acetyltransferase